jgi:hypothetical protein
VKRTILVSAVIAFGAIVVLGAMAAYEQYCDGRISDEVPANYVSPYKPVDGQDRIWGLLCEGGGNCIDVPEGIPQLLSGGAAIGVTDCTKDQTAALFGDWPDWDAGPWHFEWSAEVRVGRVFPSNGLATTVVRCFDIHWQIHSPTAKVPLATDRLAWAKLQDGDVFVPFHGDATLDYEWTATAALSDEDGAPPRATVSIRRGDASSTPYGPLAVGDAFAWGDHRASIVRIVLPQPVMLGAIGWVEVRLAP